MPCPTCFRSFPSRPFCCPARAVLPNCRLNPCRYTSARLLPPGHSPPGLLRPIPSAVLSGMLRPSAPARLLPPGQSSSDLLSPCPFCCPAQAALPNCPEPPPEPPTPVHIHMRPTYPACPPVPNRFGAGGTLRGRSGRVRLFAGAFLPLIGSWMVCRALHPRIRSFRRNAPGASSAPTVSAV